MLLLIDENVPTSVAQVFIDRGHEVHLVQPPGSGSRCVKVVLPLPRGNATVILRPAFDREGRFRLVSWGKRFGDAGFYRVLDLDAERLKVRYLKTLRERFDVYSDEEGVLRCDHEVRFSRNHDATSPIACALVGEALTRMPRGLEPNR